MKMRMLVVLAVVFTGAMSCSKAWSSKASRSIASVLVSDRQEAQLGLQVREELNKQGVRYVQDARVVNYVRGLAAPILEKAKRDRPNVAWQIEVIDDAKTVNAFATPGGYLYVYTGLLKAAESEAEVAAVMGHEAAHVTMRHSARQMVNTYGMSAVASMVLGEQPDLLRKIVAAAVMQGALLAYSRDDEKEADAYGTFYSYQAGFDAHGIAWFFDRMEREQGRKPEFLTWLSTHPSHRDRVATVNALVQKQNWAGGKRDSAEFQAIKQSIR